MLLITDNERYDLDLKELAKMLFANKKEILSYNVEIKKSSHEELMKNNEIVTLKKQDDKVKITLKKDNVTFEKDGIIDFKEKLIYKKLLYEIIIENYGDISSKWGILTGIRPVKIVNELKKEQKSSDQIKEILENRYVLSKEKIELICGISDVQDDIIETLEDDISVYISIPFCPSRCNYCSFFSIDINSGKKYIKDYLKNLDIEIKKTLEMPYFKDKNISSIYVGGGTPSSLDSEELTIFFDIIKDNFNLDKIKEFTFEAGRADTLNKEKLQLIYDNKVSRISINPQTMNDETYAKIGRFHTSDDVIKIFNQARQIGFDNINMDLILGLADEDIDDMRHSIDKIIELNPESITIHCLAIKRASDINTKNITTRPMEMSDFMQEIDEKMQKNLYNAYYLYRQKNMLENGENIGYSKSGAYSLYNVAMMDEIQSIVGFGVGSATKILDKSTNLIRRIPNFKDVILYNNNIDEIVRRKDEI